VVKSLLPEPIVEELLSLAHVHAIAAVAGISISNFDRDFDADGTFRQITILGKGEPSKNRSAVRIRIPRSQSLNPNSLSMLLRCVQNGNLPC
jgi:hypothetical protein